MASPLELNLSPVLLWLPDLMLLAGQFPPKWSSNGTDHRKGNDIFHP